MTDATLLQCNTQLQASWAAAPDIGKTLTGTGAPGSTLGTIGDLYFRKDTAGLYGPKTNSGWGTPVTFAGANGNTILTGATGPTGGIGANGDVYVDTAAKKLYGPKAADTWPEGVSLVGATGATGTGFTATGTTTLTNNTPTGLFEIAMPTNSTALGGHFVYNLKVVSGSAVQTHSGYADFTALRNGSGTITSTITESATEAQTVTSGTLTENNWTMTSGTGKVTVNASFESSLSNPTMTLTWHLVLNAANAVTAL